jgi:hypothetical protein
MLKGFTIATALCLFASAASAQTSYVPCSTQTWPGVTFGPNAPSYALGASNGACYCGVWTGVTPQQAMQAGWYASCSAGKGICNYQPGTIASNKVCGPFGGNSMSKHPR